MKHMLLIAAGGGLGSVLRWKIAEWFAHYSRNSFPAGILIVNVSGCFFFGLLQGMCQSREEWKLALLTGLLGGYTTFSTFGWDTFNLLRDDRAGLAAANAMLSVCGGVLAVWAGVALSGRGPN